MGWRAEARRAIKEYPNLIKKESALKSVSLIANYNGMPPSHIASRTTENVALKSLPRDEQRDLDAVRTAIDTIRRYRNGGQRYRLIELCYWKNTHTIDGAALTLHIHEKTAHEWDRGFVEMVDSYRRIF